MKRAVNTVIGVLALAFFASMSVSSIVTFTEMHTNFGRVLDCVVCAFAASMAWDAMRALANVWRRPA